MLINWSKIAHILRNFSFNFTNEPFLFIHIFHNSCTMKESHSKNWWKLFSELSLKGFEFNSTKLHCVCDKVYKQKTLRWKRKTWWWRRRWKCGKIFPIRAWKSSKQNFFLDIFSFLFLVFTINSSLSPFDLMMIPLS